MGNTDISPSDINLAAALAKKKSAKSGMFYTLTAVLLITAGALGWFYYDATKTVRNQKAKIASLEERLRDHGIALPAGGGADDEDEAAACEGGSAYSADIGNFAVTLSNPNVIIRNLDANFEGGPVTDLSAGRCLTGVTNVVDAYPTHKVNILGHPAADAATLRANFEAQWGSPLTAGAPVTIDGVVAQTYTGSGLFTTKLVYFDHGGIGYQIELPDVNPTSETILTDVIAGWSFTP